MRYWISRDGSEYVASEDDLRSLMNYVEVTQRPELYTDVWQWSFEDSKWILNVAAVQQAIADRRYEVETAGVYVDGNLISTTDRSKLLLMMAADRVKDSTDTLDIKWKIANDHYVSFTPAQIQTLKTKVCDYIGACFVYESQLIDRINRQDFDISELNTGWPDNVIAL